eukprot:TRINITY_DN899_c0_g1_i6.p1 TRINITY_DN899_c0_g1~~TRINITY_DN899_c0_g1_i6.p1  ORF type:complete len:134 (-),score=25.36 TRINITY_DN899_c0_g1_i6:139-540(-)
MQQHCRVLCVFGAIFLAGLAFTSPGAASPRPPVARHGSASAGPAMEAPEDAAASAFVWQLGAGVVLGFMVALSAASPAHAGLLDEYGRANYDAEKAKVSKVKYTERSRQENREKVLEGQKYDTTKSNAPPVKA